MRNNQPITNHEIKYQQGDVFISKTDLKGNITYANDRFEAISGFSKEELSGANHNLVRHPDMPEWAFADLWKTIEEGRPWRGIVKNRAKNGDHYWVRATVVRELKDNVIVGYYSIRKHPTEQEVEEACKAYKCKR